MNRVISGKYKFSKIKFLKNKQITRPMSFRIKEDLFNILNNYFFYENKIGLDLFAGSGQLGIEAISRGLKKCYLNDINYLAFNIIKKNINNLKINNSIIFNLDFNILLNIFLNNNIFIDIIFLNPPFINVEYYYKVINFFLKNNLLKKNGIIVCDSNKKLFIFENKLFLLKEKKYKNKYLYFFRKNE